MNVDTQTITSVPLDYFVPSTIVWEVSCTYCGCIHRGRICPRISEIEYHPNGNVKRVKLNEQT